MKYYILLGFLLVSRLGISQNLNREELGVPFDFPLYLSGNFGELRSNHFHAGLDFKTQHQSGKKMLALADGYISKVQVTHGSGYVLHTVHKNGLTTVNRHLMGFVGDVAALVDSIQYADESWEMSYTFEPNQFPIHKGEHIAWSGNMGYSFGPHLHFELIDTATGDLIDAMPYYEKRLKDNQAPKADSYLFIPYLNEGVINQSTSLTTRNLSDKSALTAWGKVSVGIKAFDYMDGTNNKYGVRYMKLYVDDELVFESDVDKFSSYESRMINSWTYRNYMKTYIAPNNPLRMLTSHNANNGWLNISEERPYKLKFELKDYFGNQSVYYLTIQGRKQDIPQKDLSERTYLHWNKTNTFSSVGIDLIIPRDALYEDAYLDFKINDTGEKSLSYTYQLTDSENYVPLHLYSDLRIGVLHPEEVDTTKLYIARKGSRDSWVNEGGVYKDGFVSTRIRELGTFTILEDLIPPTVTAVNKQNWAKSGEVQFHVKDKETGIASYKGTIDGEYALFYLDIMPNKIRYKLDKSRLKRGKQHKVQLEVVDHCKNRTFIEEQFFW